MMKTATALLGAAFLLAGPPAGAEAADPSLGALTHVVQTRDLDLFSAEGRRTLDRRIAAAARLVCQREDNLATRIIHHDCRKAAMETAHRQRDRLYAMRGLVGDYRTADASR